MYEIKESAARPRAVTMKWGKLRRLSGNCRRLMIGRIHPHATTTSKVRRLASLLMSVELNALSLFLGGNLLRNRPDDAWFETKITKNCVDFVDRQRGLRKVKVNDVVVAIYLVAKVRNGLQSMIKLEDFPQSPNSHCINFYFNHDSFLSREVTSRFAQTFSRKNR